MFSTMGGITMACVQQETRVLTSYTLKGHYNLQQSGHSGVDFFYSDDMYGVEEAWLERMMVFKYHNARFHLKMTILHYCSKV